MRLRRRINWDGLGIFTSILCAIHCALLPLVVSFLPLLGLNVIRNPLFEYGMIGLAFIIGTSALWHGFTRHHHRLTPWLLFAGGMILLIAKEVWGRYELYFLPFAVVLIISAHIVNYRLSRTAGRQKRPEGLERAGDGGGPGRIFPI
jgi:MerC mercury resistance protein